MDNVSSTTGRLPDFIFRRRRDIELEANVALAGMLLTDIPKGRNVSRRDRRLIEQIITQLRYSLKNERELVEAGIWRTEAKPADGLSPPSDDLALEDRSRRCICIMVTSGIESLAKVPSDLARQIIRGVVQ